MDYRSRSGQVGELQDMSRPRVLVIASDTIGERMAGSGIRYWNLARVIGAQQEVTLATPNLVDLPAPSGVTITPYGRDGATEDERGQRLAAIVEDHEVVVAQHLPYLYTDAGVLAERFLVIDLYAPWILEKLEYARVDPERGEADRRDDVTILNRLLELGDYFLAASDRQRDFWLGALAVAGRLELEHASVSPSLRSLIDVVGFGLPEQRPMKTGPGPRAVFAPIGDSDPLLLWNGGLWNWLDPLTAIEAVARVVARIPTLRLVFMGTQSPGAQVAEMEIVTTARELASRLGLLDRHVFFNDWVAYEQRQNWLLEADAAISLHVETVEARFAFRTRMLDNLWCHVPSIVTTGDVLADLVVEQGVGVTTPAQDVDAVARAIEEVLDRDRARAMRANLAALAERYTWEQVSAPLLTFCREPWKLGARRDASPQAAYLARLERLYSDTAQYARHLEQVLAEREKQLAAPHSPEQVRKRPDLGSLLRRDKRG
jgi:glycosyltransferase involved in cell wall biosynthesis